MKYLCRALKASRKRSHKTFASSCAFAYLGVRNAELQFRDGPDSGHAADMSKTTRMTTTVIASRPSPRCPAISSEIFEIPACNPAEYVGRQTRLSFRPIDVDQDGY